MRGAVEYLKGNWDALYHSKWNPEITLGNTLGERYAGALRRRKWFSEGNCDRASINASSFVMGTLLDTAASGLDVPGWLASRGQAVIFNTLTGDLYGKYRNMLYRATRTDPEKSGFRKSAVELVAFNTFQTPIYGCAVALATLLFEEGFDMESVRNGMLGIATLSPFIAPTTGWIMDKAREYAGFQTAAEHAKI